MVLDVQREEKSVHKAIKEAAKRNDMGSAKVNYQTSELILLNFWWNWSWIR